MKKIGNIIEFIVKEEREQVMVHSYDEINRVIQQIYRKTEGVCRGFACAFYNTLQHCWIVSCGHYTEEEAAKWFEDTRKLYNEFHESFGGSVVVTSMLMFESDSYHGANWGLRAACLFEDEM